MTLSENPALASAMSDADLVAAYLAGDRHAFARIVERYQRLLCSLAYSATGDMGASEDAAQETFIAAWGQLGGLREPDKLRPWLCGILRHKVGRFRRRFGRDAVQGAESLETAGMLATEDLPAAEKAMRDEEKILLWRALERVPVLYREPLVLYYRESRSIEHVAAALDLTEDAVKQRLARGRRLLQEQALVFVENALERTTPGKAFTLSVLAALPATIPMPAKVGLGAAAATQGGMIVKTTGLAALLASVSGVVSAAMQLRAGLDQSRTPRERRTVVWATIGSFFGTCAFVGVIWLMLLAAIRWPEQRVWLTATAQGLIVALVVLWPFGLAWLLRYFRRLRTAERRRLPALFQAERDRVGSRAGFYRSRASLFGVPLVHLRFASPDEGEGPVVGWIAGGDRAYGLLFAWGAVAVAPVSVGAFAAGFLAIGGVSVGVIGLGSFATGLLAIGGIAVGVKAYAGLSALGWWTAQSAGFGVARVAAEAPIAFARHANDAAGHALLTDPSAQRNQLIVSLLIAVAVLIPMALYAGAVRRRLGPAPREPARRDG